MNQADIILLLLTEERLRRLDAETELQRVRAELTELKKAASADKEK